MPRKRPLTEHDKLYLSNLDTLEHPVIRHTEKIPAITDDMLRFRQKSIGFDDCAAINGLMHRGLFRLYWKEALVLSIKPDAYQSDHLILTCQGSEGNTWEVQVDSLARFDFFFL